MLKEFTERYTPKTILHRNPQIEELNKIFNTFKKNQHPGNYIIGGFTGCGKTTVIKNVIMKNTDYIYINIAHSRTTHKTLKRLLDKPLTESQTMMTGLIERFQTPKILIFDEFNKCKDPKNFFDEINTLTRETDCSIIIISNKKTIYEDMEDDAKKTLLFRRIDFNPYTNYELYDIVQERIMEAKKFNHELTIPDEEALQKICAIGAREGSARLAVEITGSCIEMQTFSEETIDYLWKSHVREDWRDTLKKINDTEKEFLRIALMILEKQSEVKSTEIAEKMPQLSPGRISQLMDTFSQEYGILTVYKVNYGRGGGVIKIARSQSEKIKEDLLQAVM